MPGQGAERFRKWIQAADEPLCKGREIEAVDGENERVDMGGWGIG